MLSGQIKTINDTCFSEIYVAHDGYVEMATVETDDSYICFIVEKDTLKQSISALYWGQEISKTAYSEIKAKILDWSLQSMVIERSKHDGLITIERNHQAECGLYILAKDDVLHLHWDPVKLYKYIDTSSEYLNIPTTIARLELELRYSHYTIFKDIYRLPERGKAVFLNNELSIERPEHIDPPKAVPLKDDVDVISVFHELIKKTISRWPIDPKQTGAILSSGLDTGIVSHFLNEAMGEEQLHTFGYNGLDKNRDGIIKMRQETIKKLNSKDVYILMEDSLDKAYRLDQTEKRWPEETQTAFIGNVLAKEISDKNIDLIFSGIGGDELCMLTAAELSAMKLPQRRIRAGRDGDTHEDFSALTENAKKKAMPLDESSWPNGYIGYSSPNMANATGLSYLRQGIWWANPLGNAEIQMFTGFLPKEYRQNRQLSRDALSILGWSDYFVTQQPKEGLQETCESMLLNADWEAIFEDSVLCKYGFIDKEKLFEGIEIFKETLSMNVTIRIMMSLELELALKPSNIN